MLEETEFKQLSPHELQRWLEEQKPCYLIDTTIEDHYRKFHIPGAYNARVLEVTFGDQVKAVVADPIAKIVLYGSSRRSHDALVAADKLKTAGYRDIYLLAGGLEAWCAADLPVEGTGAEEPYVPYDPQTMLRLADGSFQVDSDRSSIEWTGRNPNTSHYGSIKLAGGSLSIKEGTIRGKFEIDMNAITNKSLEGDELQPVLVSHLQSDDFFLTSLFPRAQFEILNSTLVAEPSVSTPNHLINGVLELRGVKAQLDFMATIVRTEDGRLAAEAHFDIDRTKWQVIYGSSRFFEHLGMHLVFDLISFQVRIYTS